MFSKVNRNSISNTLHGLCSLVSSHTESSQLQSPNQVIPFKLHNSKYLISINCLAQILVEIVGGYLFLQGPQFRQKPISNYRFPPDIRAKKKNAQLQVSTNHYNLMINFLIPSLNFLLWYLSVYNNKIVFSDFNSETSHPGMLSFMNNKNLINFVKKKQTLF